MPISGVVWQTQCKMLTLSLPSLKAQLTPTFFYKLHVFTFRLSEPCKVKAQQLYIRTIKVQESNDATQSILRVASAFSSLVTFFESHLSTTCKEVNTRSYFTNEIQNLPTPKYRNDI